MRKIEVAKWLRPLFFSDDSCNDPDCRVCEETLDRIVTEVQQRMNRHVEPPF